MPQDTCSICERMVQRRKHPETSNPCRSAATKKTSGPSKTHSTTALERSHRVWTMPARANETNTVANPTQEPISIEPRRKVRDAGTRRTNSSCKPSFFNDTATTEIYTLSLHDALPI